MTGVKYQMFINHTIDESLFERSSDCPKQFETAVWIKGKVVQLVNVGAADNEIKGLMRAGALKTFKLVVI